MDSASQAATVTLAAFVTDDMKRWLLGLFDSLLEVCSTENLVVSAAIAVASYITVFNLKNVVLSAPTYILPPGRTVPENVNQSSIAAEDTSVYLCIDGPFLWEVALPMLAAGVLFAANFSLVFVTAAVFALLLGGLNVASGGAAAMAAAYGSKAAVALQAREGIASMVGTAVADDGPLSQFAEMAYNSYKPWLSFISHVMGSYACTFLALACSLYVLKRPRKYDDSTSFRTRDSKLFVSRTLTLTLIRTMPWIALVLAASLCVLHD